MDRHTPEQRHKNMQAVKNRDSQIELLLRKELWSRGIRYRKNSNKVFGHPDIVFVDKKVAVFFPTPSIFSRSSTLAFRTPVKEPK